jgi:phage baseplate assembly protein W
MIQSIQKYRDLPFFISKNTFTSDLNTITDMSAIRQSIKNIILTNNGERAFNYLFGGNLYSTLFENYELELILEIQSNILNNLRAYERRIEVNDILVTENPEENSVSVTVDFFVPNLQKNDVITVDLTRTR